MLIGYVGFAGFVSQSAEVLAQQPTSAQIGAIRTSRQSDYRANCAGVPPGDALACLQQNLAKLSPACQTAVSAASGGASTTPAPAAQQPAAAPARAAPTPAAPATALQESVDARVPTVAPCRRGRAQFNISQSEGDRGLPALAFQILFAYIGLAGLRGALGLVSPGPYRSKRELSLTRSADLDTRRPPTL